VNDGRPSPPLEADEAPPGDGFAALFDRFWDSTVTGDATEQQVAFVERQLRLAAGARLLLAPSGCGRLAIALAARGYRVRGIDRSAAAVLRSRALALRAGVDAEFDASDGLALDPGRGFDGAVCLGHGLTAAVLAPELAASLKPGARALIEVDRNGGLADTAPRSFAAAGFTTVAMLSGSVDGQAVPLPPAMLLCERR